MSCALTNSADRIVPTMFTSFLNPFGQSGRIGRSIMRAVRIALALEEAAGDLAGGVHPLLDVDGEREEVGALARLHAPLGGGQDHRVALTNDNGTVGLLSELARLEGDLAARDLHRDGGRALRCNAHLSSTSFWKVEV